MDGKKREVRGGEVWEVRRIESGKSTGMEGKREKEKYEK